MPSIEIDGKLITSTSILCRAPGCDAKLTLTQVMPSGYGLEGGHVAHAIELAADALGWTTTRCPKHLNL